ncbi:MAG: 4-alpha-glucanotransferase [Clostridiales bacterium]|nr:4-alpha-glucanotransferase [Clostridiales bacterium]
MKLERSSGILVHPSSFPSPYGIGDLGEGAYRFIDFLKEAKQKLWQVLPLGPTSFVDSPYQSFSTFAGNHYLISPDILVGENYLQESELWQKPSFNDLSVDYGPVIDYKMGLFRKAFEGFKNSATDQQRTQFNRFCEENELWLPDYSLFVAAKYHFIDERKFSYNTEEFYAFEKDNEGGLTSDQIKDNFYGAVWGSWPEALALHTPEGIAEWTEKLSDNIYFFKFLQYEFFRQWKLLKNYANEAGVSIIGDIPIFVAMDSSDVWANKHLFQLDSKGHPLAVAGVPPDYFSETGQLWGNPLYAWEEHKNTGYEWWINRIGTILKIVDILRVDHFRGFDAYWSVPYGATNAIGGQWIKGPGKDLFSALSAGLSKDMNELPIIAEDLGVITPEVEELRDSAGLPGMKILQFAFGSDNTNDYLPHNFKNSNSVIYTGTHDNDTTLGWYAEALPNEKDYFRKYLNVSGENPAWDLIRLAYSSSAAYAIIPIQDAMNLGSQCRMNTPGKAVGNWQFRYASWMLKDEIIKGLLYLGEVFNR